MAKQEFMTGYKLVIAYKIDKYLNETHITNCEFGKIFNVDESTIRRWRKAQSALDINQVVLLAKHWNISVDELLGLDTINSLPSKDRERLRKLEENPELALVVDNFSRK